VVPVFVLLVSLLMAFPAWADDALSVEGWARATASKARNGAVYLQIKNNSGAGDKLLSSQTDAAKRAGLHNHTMDDGVMKMRPVDAVVIPAHGMVTMKPGGLHIMLMGLAAPLVKGASLPLTLKFKNAGTVAVVVEIMGMGAKSMTHKKKHTH